MIALALRVYHLNLPFVEPYNSLSRQSIVATVARNFYQHGFHFFYPEIDENGRGPYLYNAEMPLYSYAMALGYKLTGGVHEWVARSVSVAFSMGSIFLLYVLIGGLAGDAAAFYALLFLAFSPLYLALGRAVQPDPATLFGIVGSVYFLYRYGETKRAGYYFLSAALAAFGVATKIQSLYIAIPLLYLAWHADKEKILTDYKSYVYVAIVASTLTWYFYMWRAGMGQDLIYRPYDYVQNRGPQGVGYFGLFSMNYLFRTGKWLIFHILTPIGAICFLIGILQRPKRGENLLFYAWFFGAIVYYLFFWRIIIEHAYYQMPIIPVAAFFIGKGAERCVDLSRRFKAAAAGFILLAVLSAGIALHFYKGIYFISDKLKSIVTIGEKTARLTPKGSLVVASYGGSPIQLYYCNRKGWTLDVRTADEKALIDRMEGLRRQGAAYYVITNLDQFHEVPHFETYVRGRYRLLDQENDSALFDLRTSFGETQK